MIRRREVSPRVRAEYAADTELAGQFGQLLRRAGEAEDALWQAQAAGAPLPDQRRLGLAFDAALTAAVRSAYAAERVQIGPRGYDDWIYRRKAVAKDKVWKWRTEAERLLSLRETHRLTGIVRVPPAAGPGELIA